MANYQPMRTMYAIQRFEAGTWVTTQLFYIEEYAAAKAKRLGDGYRMEPVRREIFD